MSVAASELRRFEGQYPSNAETTIDYTKKEVSFNYPNKKINLFKIYSRHALYMYSALLCGLVYWLVRNYWVSVYNPPTWLSLLTIVYLWVIWKVFGLVSYLVHRYIPRLAKDYPETNAFLKKLVKSKKEKVIDLSGNKFGHGYIIEGNKLFLLDYCIVWFKYAYKGKNKLLKFYTKSIDKQDDKKEHNIFVAVYEFEKPITEGVLRYW